MDRRRREVLEAGGGAAIWAMLVASGLVTPAAARAARERSAFDATSLDDALMALGAQAAVASDAVRIELPDVAEDGRAVPLGVSSRLPNTERIVIVIEDNPYKVAANFVLSPAMLPTVQTRVKMSGSTAVRALVKADGRFFVARREVKVIVGGCGA